MVNANLPTGTLAKRERQAHNDNVLHPALVGIVGLIALAEAMGIGRFAFTPILPMMQGDAGVSIALGSWLASANYAGYLTGSLSALAVRIEASAAIRAGLAAIALSTLFMGLLHGAVWWTLLRLIAGIGSAWVLIFVFAWSAEYAVRHERPWVTGIVFGGTGAGIVVCGGLCLMIDRMKSTSSVAWLVLGSLALLSTALVWFAFREERASSPAHASSGSVQWNAESIRAILCYGLFGFGYIIPATFLPLIAKQIVPDPSLFGLAWPIFGTAALVSTLLVSQIIHRFSYRSVWIGAQLMMIFGIVLPACWPTLPAILIAAVFVGGTFMVVPMAAMLEARTLAGPGRSAPLVAAMTSAFAAGQIAGPIATAWLIGPNKKSFSGPLLLAALLLLFTVLILLFGNRTCQKNPASA